MTHISAQRAGFVSLWLNQIKRAHTPNTQIPPKTQTRITFLQVLMEAQRSERSNKQEGLYSKALKSLALLREDCTNDRVFLVIIALAIRTILAGSGLDQGILKTFGKFLPNSGENMEVIKSQELDVLVAKDEATKYLLRNRTIPSSLAYRVFGVRRPVQDRKFENIKTKLLNALQEETMPYKDRDFDALMDAYPREMGQLPGGPYKTESNGFSYWCKGYRIASATPDGILKTPYFWIPIEVTSKKPVRLGYLDRIKLEKMASKISELDDLLGSNSAEDCEPGEAVLSKKSAEQAERLRQLRAQSKLKKKAKAPSSRNTPKSTEEEYFPETGDDEEPAQKKKSKYKKRENIPVATLESMKETILQADPSEPGYYNHLKKNLPFKKQQHLEVHPDKRYQLLVAMAILVSPIGFLIQIQEDQILFEEVELNTEILEKLQEVELGVTLLEQAHDEGKSLLSPSDFEIPPKNN